MRSEPREKRNNRSTMKPKHCTLNGIDFDSISEMKFYQRLCHIYGSGNVCRAITLTLKESGFGDVPDIKWTPDFKVSMPEGIVYVEYKGSLSANNPGTETFLLKWKFIKGDEWLRQIPIVCFVAGSKIPTWFSKNGKIAIPDIYPIAMYDDNDMDNVIRLAL